MGFNFFYKLSEFLFINQKIPLVNLKRSFLKLDLIINLLKVNSELTLS